MVDCYNGDDAVQIVTESATLYIPLAEMIDFEKELERLSADKKKTIEMCIRDRSWRLIPNVTDVTNPSLRKLISPQKRFM